MKLYVRESGRDAVRSRVNAASMVATSRVAYPEARSALARRQREGGLSRAVHGRAVAALDADFERLIVVELAASVASAAGALADERSLRGFDSIHLASALELQRLTATATSFLCFDDRLRAAAVAEGLST